MLRLPCFPSGWVSLWLLFTTFTGVLRVALRDVLVKFRFTQHAQKLRVAIYGAGEAGAQLGAALRLTGNHKIVTFLMILTLESLN